MVLLELLVVYGKCLYTNVITYLNHDVYVKGSLCPRYPLGVARSAIMMASHRSMTIESAPSLCSRDMLFCYVASEASIVSTVQWGKLLRIGSGNGTPVLPTMGGDAGDRRSCWQVCLRL